MTMKDAEEMSANFHGRWILRGNVMDLWTTPGGRCGFCGDDCHAYTEHIVAHVLENGYTQASIDALTSAIFMAGGDRHSCDSVAAAFFGAKP